MDDAVEFRDDGERMMRRCLGRQQLDGGLEENGRERHSPHLAMIPESESGDALCASQSRVMGRIKFAEFAKLIRRHVTVLQRLAQVLELSRT